METVNKKAITPLMAGFLLLSFAVAIGVFFTNLAKAQAEESAVCPVNIDLRQSQICLRGNEIFFSVQNSVNTDINGFIISVIGTEEAKTVEFNDLNLAKGGIYSNTLPYDLGASGSIRQIKITPKIKLYNELQICTEQGLVIENVETC